MDLALIMFLGLVTLPWYWTLGFVFLCLVAVALCELLDEFAWAVFFLLAGGSLVMDLTASLILLPTSPPF